MGGGKSQRKKKGVIRAFEKGSDAVRVISDDLEEVLGFSLRDPDVICVWKLIDELASATSLSQQVRIVRAFKREALQSMKDPNRNKDVCVLLELSLSPRYFMLHESFDWLGDFLCSLGDGETLKQVVQERCFDIVSRATSSCTESTVDIPSSTAACLVAMSNLDRGFPWIGTADTAGALTDSSMVLKFLRLLGKVFSSYATLILERVHDGRNSSSSSLGDGKSPVVAAAAVAAVAVSSTEVIRYTDACGDCLRALYTILKNRSFSYAPSKHCKGWISFAREFWDINLQLLRLDFLNRDIITAIAISSVSLVWLLRFENVDAATATAAGNSLSGPRIQLEGILQFLEVRPSHGSATLLPGYPAAVQEMVVPLLSTLSELARCAFLRACLVIFDDSSIETTFSTQVNDVPPKYLLNGYAFRLTVFACSSSSPEVRFYGIQTLESWLNRAIVFVQTLGSDAPSHIFIDVIQGEFRDLSKLLTKSWSFPSKQVNHLVPSVYKKLLEIANVLHQKRLDGAEESVSAEVSVSSLDFWRSFVADAIELPAMQRGRYHALVMLIPHVTASVILALQPNLLDILIGSMWLRDIASSVSGLIVAFLTGLQSESWRSHGEEEQSNHTSSSNSSTVTVRQLWEKPVAAALCSPDGRMRINIADYLVPALLEMDPTCATSIINAVRSLLLSHADKDQGAVRSGLKLEWVLWGMVNVSLQAKMKNLSGAAIAATGGSSPFRITDDDSFAIQNTHFSIGSDGPMTVSEVVTACSCDDSDIRLAALSFLIVSHRTALPLDDLEIGILRATFPLSLKCTSSDQRQKILRVAKTVISRQIEASRVAAKEAASGQKRRKILLEDLSTARARGDDVAVLAIETKLSEVSQGLDVSLKQSSLADTAARWMAGVLLQGLYPGTVLEKEATVLDVLAGVIDVAEQHQHSCLQFFFTSAYVDTLLNTMCSGWDKTRRMAADVLLKFPKPLPSYSTPGAVAVLLKKGFTMMGSPRQRESDAGALLLRSIFNIYVASLGWRGSLSLSSDSSSSYFEFDPRRPEAHEDPNSDLLHQQQQQESIPLLDSNKRVFACVAFIDVMCDVLENRLVVLSRLFDNELRSDEDTGRNVPAQRVDDSNSSSSALCNGILLTIRYCLEEAKKLSLYPGGGGGGGRDTKDRDDRDDSPLATWTPTVQRILSLSIGGLNTAMRVVAEAPSDVQFAPPPTAKGLEEYSARITTAGSSKGPIGAASYMSATYVNTNSFVGATDAENDPGDDLSSGESASTFQRAVVAAWLLVKEATALLAFLVDTSPPPAQQLVADSSSSMSVSVSVATLDSDSSSPMDKNGVDADADVVTSLRANSPDELLSFEDISGVGELILDALGRLKHMGALSETQAALQTIAERLLKHGDRCLKLCRLPSIWLRGLLARLDRVDQVFILRRSAGFAYSIVSLLRAEPSNVKATLLPVAANSLLDHAESGMVEEEEEDEHSSSGTQSGGASSSREKWRSSVHALNVLRVVIVDAALGSDLDNYIARSLELAVRGFSSSKWAVRNSSMMLFSSVIQRAVDNDKNELGGARATTASEFFARFPSLFPFLLAELARVTGYTVESTLGWPVSVVYKEGGGGGGGREGGGACESLFPILLLLAKLRSDLSTKDDYQGNEESAVATKESHANLSLFVPLVESCRSQKLQKVREMAAKALAALIPTQSVPNKALELISSITAAAAGSRELSGGGRNECHGYLCLVFEIIDSTKRRLNGLGGDIDFNACLAVAIKEDLFPAFTRLFRVLSTEYCPVIHLVFLRILETTLSLLKIVSVPNNCIPTIEALIVRECELCLRPLFLSTHDQWVQQAHLPYSPVLYKEALVSFTVFAVRGCIASSGGLLSSASASNSTVAVAAGTVAPLEQVIQLLSCPISEVREGVLYGIREAILSTTTSSQSFLVDHETLLWQTMAYVVHETEAELLTLALETICRLSTGVGLRSLRPAARDIFLCDQSWDFLSFTASVILGDLENKKLSSIITTAVAPAIEIMGWLLQEIVSSPESISGERVSHWVALVAAASSEDSPVECREAAARAILLSTYLSSDWISQFPSHTLRSHVTSLWLTTLTLLQDDDGNVRSVASQIVSARMSRDEDAETTSVGLVQDLALNGLVKYLAHSLVAVVAMDDDGSDTLSQEVTSILNRIDGRIGTESDVSDVVRSDGACLTSKIFLEEQANLYIEATVDALALVRALSLASAALCDASRSAIERAAGHRIVDVLLRRAVAGLRVLNLSSQMSWIGGGTFQKDVFSYVLVGLECARTVLKELVDHGVSVDSWNKIIADININVATHHLACRNPWFSSTFSILS